MDLRDKEHYLLNNAHEQHLTRSWWIGLLPEPKMKQMLVKQLIMCFFIIIIIVIVIIIPFLHVWVEMSSSIHYSNKLDFFVVEK